MLTAEILKGSAALATLTEEQIAAVTELSKNDENAVIAKKLGEVHGQYDRDISEATGLKKPDGVKTYDWMKTTVLPKVKQSTELEEKLKTAQTEKATLEQQLKDGKVDEAVKQKLIDSEKLVADLQAKVTADKEAHEKALLDAQTQNASILVNNEFDRALVGKKFKDEKIISKAVRESFINNAKTAILAENKADWIDDGKGGKTLVFRDEKGEIKRNPENGLNPYTAQELFIGKIGDVLDLGKQQKGAGTEQPGGGAGGAGSALDLAGATTQVEADELTTDYLMGKGLTRGSQEYNDEFTKIREENKVGELPIR